MRTAGGSQAFAEPRDFMAWISISTFSTPSRSALFTMKMSATSMMPALMAWISSPMPGTSTTQQVCTQLTTSTSSWPTPTVSTMTTSHPAASRRSMASWVARARPPRAPRVAMERMKIPGSDAMRPMRMRSPRMAPPLNGEVGSTARIPTRLPSARRARASWSVSVDFPLPGDPVSPRTTARPRWGQTLAMRALASGWPFSIQVMARARALGLPSRRGRRSREAFSMPPGCHSRATAGEASAEML